MTLYTIILHISLFTLEAIIKLSTCERSCQLYHAVRLCVVYCDQVFSHSHSFPLSCMQSFQSPRYVSYMASQGNSITVCYVVLVSPA